MSSSKDSFDLLVIGSGPGGYRAAVLAALRGQKAAIVERHTWGGTCLNRGCVPKKDWHYSAKLIRKSRAFAERGLVVDGVLRGDMQQAWQHQRKVVETVRASYVDYLQRLGTQQLEGHGRFLDAHTVEVAGRSGRQRVSAEHIIIATGSAPITPAGLALIPGKLINSDMLYDDGVPPGDRVAIIGGGVIGVEFAFIFQMLGKQVEWLVDAKPLSKSLYSPQALGALMKALKSAGVEPKTRCRVQAVVETAAGLELQLCGGETVTVDWAVLATGRRPYTAELGLEHTGVQLDERGFVRTNNYLQTAEPHIYAIGDVVGPYMNANQALADATLAVHNIIDGNSRKRKPLWVPELVYSAVEMGRIGMNDDMAEDEDFEPAVGFAAFETSPRALGQDDTEGFVRLLADMDSGELLGGEIVGDEAGELIHLLALAPDRDTALRWIANGHFNHPARSEELLNATETLAAQWGLAEQIFSR